MKLYVWEDVLRDYTSGIMLAIAESPDHARQLLLVECPYIPEEDLAKEPHEHELTQPYAAYLWGGG